MRGWRLVTLSLLSLLLLGLGVVSCRDRELEVKLAAAEAKVAESEAKATACESTRVALESKVKEQELELAKTKAEMATLRSTLPAIKTGGVDGPSPRPAGSGKMNLGF